MPDETSERIEKLKSRLDQLEKDLATTIVMVTHLRDAVGKISAAVRMFVEKDKPKIHLIGRDNSGQQG